MKKLFSIGLSLALSLGVFEPVSTRADEIKEDFTRLYGENRYETNQLANQIVFPQGSDLAILVSGEVFPDTLSAFNLAEAYQAPLVLTEPDRLNPHTKALLDDLGVREIIVVGGRNTLSSEFFDKLKEKYKVTRIAGKDRYETSQEVYDKVSYEFGLEGIIYVDGHSYQNALSVAKYAKDMGYYINLDPYLNTGEVQIFRPDEIGVKKVFAGGATEMNKIFFEKAAGSNVLISSLFSFPDALSAVSLVAAGDYKILLVEDFNKEIVDLYPQALVIGGPNTIPYD